MERDGFLRVSYAAFIASALNMRALVAIAIGLVGLYVVDSYWFDGLYFHAVRDIAAQVRQHF